MSRNLGLNLDTSSLKKSWNPKQETIDESKESDNLGGFDCNICLDTVEDPVVTLCGHLYCWPCIYKWIHNQSQETSENQEPKCPVCKSQVSEKTMIPLYGPGSTPKPSDKKGETPGIAIPQRPPTPRTPNLQQIRPIYQQSFPQLNQHSNPGNRTPNGHHLPAGGMFGEMVYSRMFPGATMMAYPNSYNLGVSASPRVRRHIKEVDRSLSRLCCFMFCCLILCLLLF